MNLKNWPYAGSINYPALAKAQKVNSTELKNPRYSRYFDALTKIRGLVKRLKKNRQYKNQQRPINIKNGLVTIAPEIKLTDKDLKTLKTAIKSMIPWRKGPFQICHETIDAEWRSDLKWQRVKKHSASLQGKVILDIGCNNGYYLYHIAKQNPKYLLGIDPVIPYYYQYQFLKQFYAPPKTEFRLLGIQDLIHFNRVFDCVFCMGIVYHHPNPIDILKNIYNAMRPGGLLIIESQGINTNGPYCLFPKNRYLKLPGHWFIPSKEALENMIRRSGFQYVETFLEVKLDSIEQRQTKDSPYDSLVSGLDPHNPDLSVEGYPAPYRFYVKARRARVRR